MKFFIGLLMLAAVASCSADSMVVVRRSVTCQSVLSAKVCGTLSYIATKLKLLPSKVEEGVNQAIANGERRIPEIYKKVVEFMKTQVLNRDCEYFLAQAQCVRLRNAIKPLNIATTLGSLVIEAIVKGVPGEAEIALRVLNLIRKEVVGKRCDELLAAHMCDKLKQIAIKLTLKAIDTARYAVEAIIAGFEKRDEIYQAVIDFFRLDVASITCEDILSKNVCSTLKSFGKIFKISTADIDKEVKEAILRGKLALQEIMEDVKNFIKKISLQKPCRDMLPDKFCSAAESMAKDMRIKTRLVAEAVEDAMRKGKTDFNEFLNSCKEFFQQRVTCESWLGEKICRGVRNFAKKVGVKTREVEAKIKELIAKGKTSVSDIYKQVVSFIRNKIFG